MRALILAVLAVNSQAATLAADSLVCESPADLEFAAKRPELVGQPASVVMSRAKASVEGYRLSAKTRSMVFVQRTQTPEAERSEEQGYQSLVASCAASQGSQVTILEKKP